jgi:catechol 2,3-dioxygenase-like lactoylglutathione lyase family enzyme
MIHIRGVHHLALTCKDMVKTVDFYTRILGLKLTVTLEIENGWKHFFFDMGGESQLAFLWFPDTVEGREGEQFPATSRSTLPSGAMHHVAFTVEDLAALSRARERLLAASVEVTDIWDHDFCKSIYFKDPDGLQLELAAWVRPLGEEDVLERYRAPTS